MKQQWREVSVVVSLEAADAVSDKLIEFGSGGTVFEDVEHHPGLCRIKAYYPDSSENEHIIAMIQRFLEQLPEYGLNAGVQTEVSTTLIDRVDWNTAWKQYFKPVRIGKHLVVKPSWESYDARPDDIIVEIDPGMAFGSGLHPTTRLVIQFLEHYLRPESDVFDVGTGSGILSIAAACLGANSVLGIDIDADAVEIARENVLKNVQNCHREPPISDRIEIECGSMNTMNISRQFDCIVMNIRPNIILPLVPYAATYLRTGGTLIISGILEEEGPDLINGTRPFNFIVQNQSTEEGWVAYVLSEMRNA